MAKEKKREEFIADRVRALATVYLTRRDDLIITDVDRSEGFDLRVQLLKEKGRAFGVVLTGAWKSTDATHVASFIKPTVAKILKHGPLFVPVCTFCFMMEEFQAWYAWLAEPVVTRDGAAKLAIHKSPECRPLDRDPLNKIVDQVNRWYDALSFELLAEDGSLAASSDVR